MKRRYQVTIIKSHIKPYRISFYRSLGEALAGIGVDLTVLYSNPNIIMRQRGDNNELPQPLGKKVPRIYWCSNRFLLQTPSIADMMRSDLIIIVQASGYLLNYPLLLLSRLGLKKIAFWGHGFNRQGNADSWSERSKRLLADWTDWWFAYTPKTADYLTSLGVAPEKITPIENAIDTRAFQDVVRSVTPQELRAMRSRLGIAEGDRVGLYCGSLYKEKRVPYLLGAAALIAAVEPRFRLLVVGGGSEMNLVQSARKDNPAIAYAGPLFGREKAICFRMSEVCLHPGAVGLGILDSFAAGLPFITTAKALHGPEIDYLIDGKNGLMISGDEEIFAKSVAQLLRDPKRAALLRQGAETAASRYTIENMVQNVVKGIAICLKIDISLEGGQQANNQ